MNEQIKKLARSSGCNTKRITGGVARYPDLDADLEKFAELLITRILDCVYDELHDPTSDLSYHSVNSIKRRINEYFGKENNDSSKR